ncbi:MAG: 50S ribosomal protein L4 [Candidatus Omnitrophica bacterium]|nr:50S ribosomal protein L4 [Candidatus Omnitrophota bacterium]
MERPAKPRTEGAKDHSLSVYDMNGKTLETVKIDPLLQEAVNTHVVYQAVLKYQAGEREGTASTKERGQVSGGGKKPWKQKGTGQARHGSRRSPIWRGGGTTFGPMPRDYSYSISPRIRTSAVLQGMRDKAASHKLVLVDRLEFDSPKTKAVSGFLNRLKLEKPLLLVEKKTENLCLASRNIPGVTVKTAAEVNALDVVSHKECVMTKAAYSGLLKRLKP